MKPSIPFLILCCLFLLPLTSPAKVTLKGYSQLIVDQRYDSLANPSVVKIMNFYKLPLDKLVNRRIGTSAVYMESRAPESLLSNFLADQLFLQAAEYVPEGIDLAIINLGGIRTAMPTGPVTVGDIFRIMPFENELVVLELRGSDVRELMDRIAREGGEGVSNVRFEIAKDKAANLTIGGDSLQENRVYRVATMDYLAAGNSGMTAMLRAMKRIDTHLKIRDAYIRRIEKITADGGTLNSALDGRIRISSK
jgi:2',3'-cyclic-nucleotide 2'-phosphodiesterase (5'-nucleotidase family)